MTLFVGTSGGQLATILLAPLLTRIYSPEEYGLYGLFSAATSALVFLVSLKLDVALYSTRNWRECGRIFQVFVYVGGSLCLAATLVLLLAGNWFQVPAMFLLVPLAALLQGAFNVLVSLNQPSQEKYEPCVEPGGLVVYNQSLISHIQARKDLSYLPVPASEMATQIGNTRVANVIMVGALVTHTQMLRFETLCAALKEMVGGKGQQLVELNLKALEAGKRLAEEFTSSHKGA